MRQALDLWVRALLPFFPHSLAVIARLCRPFGPGERSSQMSMTVDGEIIHFDNVGLRYGTDRRPTLSKWMIRSEEHNSELQSLMRSLSAVFCLNKKNNEYTQAFIVSIIVH